MRLIYHKSWGRLHSIEKLLSIASDADIMKTHAQCYLPKHHNLDESPPEKAPLNLAQMLNKRVADLLFPIATTYWELYEKHGETTPFIYDRTVTALSCMQADLLASSKDDFLPYGVLETVHRLVVPQVTARGIRKGFRKLIKRVNNYEVQVIKDKGYQITHKCLQGRSMEEIFFSED